MMNQPKLLLTIMTSTLCFSGIAAASPKAQDHNSTRSNRGAIAAPVDTGHKIEKQHAGELSNVQSVKGRNPQTGKEINTVKKKTGRNPQTGKEINIRKRED